MMGGGYQQFPSTNQLERDFAASFERRVMSAYVNNPNYTPANANNLAIDLLNSGYLESSKHTFVLEPFEVRIIGFQGDIARVFPLFSLENYFNNGLPTVYDPGYDIPIRVQGANGTYYDFVINYQINFPF